MHLRMSPTLHYPELGATDIPDPKTETETYTHDLSAIGGGQVTASREVVVGCTAEEAGEEPHNAGEYGERCYTATGGNAFTGPSVAVMETPVGGVAAPTVPIRLTTLSTTSYRRRRAGRGGTRAIWRRSAIGVTWRNTDEAGGAPAPIARHSPDGNMYSGSP